MLQQGKQALQTRGALRAALPDQQGLDMANVLEGRRTSPHQGHILVPKIFEEMAGEEGRTPMSSEFVP